MQPVPEAIASHSASQGTALHNWPLQHRQAPVFPLGAAKYTKDLKYKLGPKHNSVDSCTHSPEGKTTEKAEV